MKKSHAWGLAVFAACNIYPNFTGEYYAGPVDPVGFPPAYLGGAANNRAGTGSFFEEAAYSIDQKIGYFAFPYAPTVLPPTGSKPPDPLLIEQNGKSVSAMPSIATYVFDADQPGTAAYPTISRCSGPGGYQYNGTDPYDASQQYPVFSALPTASYNSTSGKAVSWSYEPIAQEYSVSAAGTSCQAYKTTGTVQGSDPSAVSPDHFYLAWPIIDPGAAVYRVGQSSTNANGLSAQKYGWYDHYLVAYLDGGYIPTVAATAADGVTPELKMTPQNLYYPRNKIVTKSGGTPAAGAIGFGYDVIDVPRGAQGYSPVCAVQTYDTSDPKNPTPITNPTLSQLPTNSGDVLDLYGTTLQAASPAYIYCLQVD